MGILPPGVKDKWDDNVPWMQAMLLGYSDIREHEEGQQHLNILRASGAKIK